MTITMTIILTSRPLYVVVGFNDQRSHFVLLSKKFMGSSKDAFVHFFIFFIRKWIQCRKIYVVFGG